MTQSWVTLADNHPGLSSRHYMVTQFQATLVQASNCHQILKISVQASHLQMSLASRNGHHHTEQTFNRHVFCQLKRRVGCFGVLSSPTAHINVHIIVIARCLMWYLVVSQFQRRKMFQQVFSLSLMVKHGRRHSECGTRILDTEKGNASTSTKGKINSPQCGLCDKGASFAGVQCGSYVSKEAGTNARQTGTSALRAKCSTLRSQQE